MGLQSPTSVQELLIVLVLTSPSSRAPDPGVNTSYVAVTHSGGELYKAEMRNPLERLFL